MRCRVKKELQQKSLLERCRRPRGIYAANSSTAIGYSTDRQETTTTECRDTETVFAARESRRRRRTDRVPPSLSEVLLMKTELGVGQRP